jgi:hypothetical protein
MSTAASPIGCVVSDFAEWEARLTKAERLDQEAERLETSLVSTPNR